tara:strand:- start:605 stop:994 length:390 start_codon:yes stop_codon:yes gene_type:complete
MKQVESKIQEAIIKYLNLAYPDTLYCASAGGLRTSFKQAIMMKRTGYMKGFPDIGIYEPRNVCDCLEKYHGLFIEVKTKTGRPSKSQLQWQIALRKRHYIAEIVYGFEEAKKVIDKYLKINNDKKKNII